MKTATIHKFKTSKGMPVLAPNEKLFFFKKSSDNYICKMIFLKLYHL